MTENAEQHGRKRYASLAAALSIVMPGVGHVYCGRLARGLFFGLLYGVAIPIVLGALAYVSPASTATFVWASSVLAPRCGIEIPLS